MGINRDNIITAIDIGSAKTVVLAAEATDQGLRYLTHGVAESHGTRKGVIADLEKAAKSVNAAVSAAEELGKVQLDSASIGVSGAHIRALNTHGAISLGSRARTVERDDVRAVVDKVRAVTLPEDRQILHLLPREFVVDSEGGVRDPGGMQARTLEVMVHAITASATAVQNVVSTLSRNGMKVEDTIFEALAASDAVLRSDERELGAAVVDIGAGSTDVIVFHEGMAWHSVSLPIGGDHFTNDIAVGLRTPLSAAEGIKKEFGDAVASHISETSEIEAPSVGDKPSRLMSQRLLGEILEPRARELMELLGEALTQVGELPLSGGVVLTGGGAKLQGLTQIAEEVLGREVRLGLPLGLPKMPAELATPEYSAVIGMVYYAHRRKVLNAPPQTGAGGRLRGFLSKLGLGS